ncbi:hypothetical protein N7530_009530 [Penicillium desertorum]|uniref:Helicase C-terminal domain-containing protein n=1 Tax=Penicillium desertorum TaxID=1303715 RepID=A0A9W9WIM9_9EURO|nr:hypothetical protein N7530_009530 [Penicillium desertorum]
MACDRVILLSPGRSWGQESQAIGRCLRPPDALFQTLIINIGERPLQEIMVKLLNNIQPQVNACYATEPPWMHISPRSPPRAKAAKDKLDSDGGGSTGPDIWLPKRSKDDDKYSTYVPDTESEANSDSGAEDNEEVGDSGDELFDTIDLGRSLEKILTFNVKINVRESWKEFADRHQPDDNTRYLMALLEFPDQKSWSVEDLEDSGYLHLGLLLLYNHISGIPTVHLGSSIHTQYPDIPEESCRYQQDTWNARGAQDEGDEGVPEADCG